MTWPSMLGRTVGEPALRAGRRDARAHEVAVELPRDAVDGMPLGHQAPIGWPAIEAGRLELGDLGDAARVTLLARERLGDEHVDEVRGLLDGVLAGADRDDVGVVVLAGERRSRFVPHEGGADAAHLVRRDLLAVARTAEHDAERLDARGLVGDDRRAPR